MSSQVCAIITTIIWLPKCPQCEDTPGMSQIEVRDLKKHYEVHHKEAGLRGSIRSLVRREIKIVRAVDGISFDLEPGEIVGFLGPNGAGKTTTLKVLSGLLYPTGGGARVLGFTPHERKREFLRQITLVMGQKNQLIWDLPANETFLVNQAVYEIPDDEYRRTLAELTDLLGLEGLLTKQVRKLSLGERMKCELAAALLHCPKVLFLDEPTIGLDVTMQAKIREFIAAYNVRHQATVILTSHYMADVTALAKRVIVIDRGKLIYDGNLGALIHDIAPYKVINVTLRRPVHSGELERYGRVQSIDTLQASLEVARSTTSDVAARLLRDFPVDDLTIEEPPVEEVISRVFRSPTELNKTNTTAS